MITKEKRHLIYKEVRHELDSALIISLCYNFRYVLNELIMSENVLLELFPELRDVKPDVDGSYWWPLDQEGLDKRKQAIDYCIEQTKPNETTA